MEPEEKQKQLNDDVVLFVRKRSEHDDPRYKERLRTVLAIQQKRRRANAARNPSERTHRPRSGSSNRKSRTEVDQPKDKSADNNDRPGNNPDGDDRLKRKSRSRSASGAACDACGRRRRRRRRRSSSSCRRRRRRRRRRPCRRRRRRRSCRRRRRRSRRKRRRSCSRRRRRRSCMRRRRRRRRRRC